MSCHVVMSGHVVSCHVKSSHAMSFDDMLLSHIVAKTMDWSMDKPESQPIIAHEQAEIETMDITTMDDVNVSVDDDEKQSQQDSEEASPVMAPTFKDDGIDPFADDEVRCHLVCHLTSLSCFMPCHAFVIYLMPLYRVMSCH